MPIVQTQALLFDMDGVLTNSIPAVERVWRGWAIEHGFDPEHTVHLAHGRPSLTTVRELLPHADHAAENRIIEQREIDDVSDIVPLPGAAELLRALPPDRWTIVTSCTRRLAEVRIAAAGLPVPKHFVTSTDVVNGKPHPEPFLKGAAMLGFSAAECLVVEDAPAGVAAGRAAGARVIAVRTTSPEAKLLAAGASWICNNCGDIQLLSADADGLVLQLP